MRESCQCKSSMPNGFERNLGLIHANEFSKSIASSLKAREYEINPKLLEKLYDFLLITH